MKISNCHLSLVCKLELSYKFVQLQIYHAPWDFTFTNQVEDLNQASFIPPVGPW